MAQVPYSPIPNVTPNLQPARPIFVNSPEAAFGGDVAQARGMLGRALDSAGNELATRAAAMQQINNEATARATAVNFSNDAAQALADFRTKQGADAGPAAYQDYQNKLGALRDKYRQGLNPVAGTMYDEQSYSVLERTNLWAAMHSSQQLDDYNKVTAVAGAEAARNMTMLNPSDEKAFDAALKQSDDAVATKFRGMGQEVISNQQSIARSTVAVSRIRAMADMPGGAPAAKQLFDRALENQTLRGEDIPKLRDYIQTEMTRHTSVSIAHGVMSGAGLENGRGIVPIDQAREAIAAGEGNYGSVNPHTGALGRYQVMPRNLAPWLAEAGLPQMTQGEFLADHAAQDKVFDTIFGGYMTKYGSANDAASAWFTGRPMGKVSPGTNDGNKSVLQYVADFNARLAQGSSLKDRVAVARAQAAKMDPDNPELADRAAAHVEQLTAEQIKINKQNNYDVQNTIDQGILDQTGKGPLTVQTLLTQNPDFAAAYKSMDAKGQMAVDRKVLAASRADNVESDERTTNTNRLSGLAYVDPEKFKSADLWNENLTQQQRTTLMSEQKELIRGKPLTDPVLTAALKDPDVRDQLTAAGADRVNNPTEYQQFVGALRNELLDARAAGKAIGPQEYTDITNRLLQQQDPSAWFFQSGHAAQYTIPLENITRASGGQAWLDKTTNELTAKLGRAPTPNEIEHIWALAIYNQVNNSKQGPAQPPAYQPQRYPQTSPSIKTFQ